MEWWRNGIGSSLVASSFSFKGKLAAQTNKKSHGKRKVTRKLKRLGNFRPPWPWHPPWSVVVSTQPALPLPERVILCFALDRDLCLGLTVLGLYWASFASILDLVWPYLLYLLLTLGLICVNLHSELEQVKIKRNRKNIGINCKIMQIDPKIESKSFKIHMPI